MTNNNDTNQETICYHCGKPVVDSGYNKGAKITHFDCSFQACKDTRDHVQKVFGKSNGNDDESKNSE